MTPTLDQIRAAGESKIERILQDSDAGARKILGEALRKYGRVEDIPESVWQQIRDHYADNDALAAAIILLFVSADSWTIDELARQGLRGGGLSSSDQLATYSLRGAKQVQGLSSTVDTLRGRLARKVQDSRLTGPGATGELTDDGIEKVLDDVFTQGRRQTISIDQTTGAISGGQLGARDRVAGGDGATVDIVGRRMTVALIWHTERDNLVCPRCAPLEGQPEEVWALVFPEGPGEDCHPNCRCSLVPRAVPFVEEAE